MALSLHFGCEFLLKSLKLCLPKFCTTVSGEAHVVRDICNIMTTVDGHYVHHPNLTQKLSHLDKITNYFRQIVPQTVRRSTHFLTPKYRFTHHYHIVKTYIK